MVRWAHWGMPADHFIEIVQRAYPRIWIACHVEHRTRGEPHPSGLTDRESTLLAHIEHDHGAPSELAQHLGIAKSTLSAHVGRLESLGLIETIVDERDQRRKRLRLTDAGQSAVRRESVLDAARVAEMLAHLTEDDRSAAVNGLALLGEAALAMMHQRRGGEHS
jgi:DNA-binding MarR family transcriptional regulator